MVTLSIDLPDDEPLKAELEEALDELKKLSLRSGCFVGFIGRVAGTALVRLKAAKTFDQMEPVCEEIWDMAPRRLSKLLC